MRTHLHFKIWSFENNKLIEFSLIKNDEGDAVAVPLEMANVVGVFYCLVGGVFIATFYAIIGGCYECYKRSKAQQVCFAHCNCDCDAPKQMNFCSIPNHNFPFA